MDRLIERESIIERFLVERVRLLGGMTMKLAPTTKGMPDRLVVLPGNRIYMVELKATDGRLSVTQEHFIEVMGYLDVPVAVLYSRVEVMDWISTVSEDAWRDTERAASLTSEA